MSLIWTLPLLFACGEKSPSDTANDDVTTEDTATTTEPSSETDESNEPSNEPGTEDTNAAGISDYSVAGPYTVSSSSQSVSLSNCDSPMNITTVLSSNNTDTTAIIAHGFFRSSANMTDWAEHFGSWGINAIVVDMCHFSDHQKNGLAIAELAGELGISSPLFVGFSAGGLASLVAASSASPQGVLVLDPVDDMNSTGTTIYGQVNTTVLGLIGEPSECNSQNNSISLLQGVQADHTLRIVDADHCDFEAPTDDLCENGVLGFGACGNTQATFSDDTIRGTIRGLGTAGLLWMSDMDADAAAWWTGAGFDNLNSQGYISAVQ